MRVYSVVKVQALVRLHVHTIAQLLVNVKQSLHTETLQCVKSGSKEGKQEVLPSSAHS